MPVVKKTVWLGSLGDLNPKLEQPQGLNLSWVINKYLQSLQREVWDVFFITFSYLFHRRIWLLDTEKLLANIKKMIQAVIKTL